MSVVVTYKAVGPAIRFVQMNVSPFSKSLYSNDYFADFVEHSLNVVAIMNPKTVVIQNSVPLAFVFVMFPIVLM